MKKLFAALLSLCLLLTGVAAIAEGTADQPIIVNVADYESQIAATEGQFATIGATGLKMFVPAEFKDTQLTEEARNNGMLMLLKAEGKDVAVTSQVVDTDRESYIALAAAAGHTTRETIINGVKYIQFSVVSNGNIATSFALPTTDGRTFAFAENLKDAYTDVIKMMAASLQPAK